MVPRIILRTAIIWSFSFGAPPGHREPGVTAEMDEADEPLLLRAWQLRVGPLPARGGRALRYRHIAIDEVQDFSPLELAVLLDATLVRGLLVPATMRLLGNINWYWPRAS
jgi:hypothetical protein